MSTLTPAEETAILHRIGAVPVFRELASRADAYHRCNEPGRGMPQWARRHREIAEYLARQCLPHGSGFDAGCTFDIDASSAARLVFHTSFHHMDEHGSYDGWTEHRVIVTPTLLSGDFDIRITGRDRNGIKDHAAQVFDACLRDPVGRCADAARILEISRSE